MIKGPIAAPESHFARKYRRIKARSGRKTAIGVVKRTMLVAIYDVLEAGELYKPPTPNPSAKRKQHQPTTKRLIQNSATPHAGNVNGPRKPVATPASLSYLTGMRTIFPAM
jgi:hypothetical protein